MMSKMNCLRCGKTNGTDIQPCEHCGFNNKIWKEARAKLLKIIKDALKEHARNQIVERVMQLPNKYLEALGYYDKNEKWMRTWIAWALDEEFGV